MGASAAHRWLRWGLAIAVLLVACGGYQPSPYAQRKAYQSNQARRLRAASTAPKARSWRAFARKRLRVHVGPAYRQHNAQWRTHVADQVERANAILKQSLGIELSVVSVQAWEPESSLEDLYPRLDELAAHDDGRDADWVLGLVGSMPLATNSFRQLGAARVLGKHLVMRDMDSYHERQSIAELDTLDDRAQRDLYRGRRRHKETTILLHELGHTLGAMHMDSELAFMNPGYSNRMRVFADGNLTLMRRVLAFHQEVPEERDLRALIAGLSSYAQANPQAGWVMEERAQYVTQLEAALRQINQQTTSGESAAQDPAQSPPPADDGPESDVSALDAGARKAFAQVRKQAQAGELGAAYAGAVALADSHADSYAVQHLACRLAMEIGRLTRKTRGYCDRMAVLASQAAGTTGPVR